MKGGSVPRDPILRGMGVPLMGPPPPEVAHRFRVTDAKARSKSWVVNGDGDVKCCEEDSGLFIL